ncbi:MAG: pyruvate, phosphate dikinase [Pirellulaceae bacterium]
MSTKHVYQFTTGKADGDATMRILLGGKGANIAEMATLGLPVPAGFTITTDVCTYYYDQARVYPQGLVEQVEAAMRTVEREMDRQFGSTDNPLLVSCRSGARDSMPGMMDTVLNIGLNDVTVEALAQQSGDERFAWDCYRRFVQMYGDVVLGMKPEKKEDTDPFEDLLGAKKKSAQVEHDHELSPTHLKELVAEFKKMITERTGCAFPDEPETQLWGAMGAVFDSWMTKRAVAYRRMQGIPHDWGTAVNIQAMVFGNLGDDCATGVALTRNISDGRPGLNGDYLRNAQGEDVVAGVRVTKRIEESLANEGSMPGIYQELEGHAETLEKHYRDAQDIEFTVEKGKLWLLQTRNAKRTGFAHVRIAVDMVNEGLITPEEALDPKRVPAESLTHVLRPVFRPEAKKAAISDGRFLTEGVNGAPGAATGQICFFPDEAKARVDAARRAQKDLKVILVRRETTPEDIHGMAAAEGILTAFGGAASHAALVSKQMGKGCVCGCAGLEIDYANRVVRMGGKQFKERDPISIDGFTGEVFEGAIETIPSEVVRVVVQKSLDPGDSEVYQRYHQLMNWADRYRQLLVRTNSDLPEQAGTALALGAQGIGLCRTEHMFFNHIDEFRQMILADSMEDREKALAKLLPYQREGFSELFRLMEGRPVTIRLLDPPLHEFLPRDAADQADLAKKMGLEVGRVSQRVDELAEANPMLGHRGCRLGIVYPEITRMQTRAIFEAACDVMADGVDVHPEVMIPLVGFVDEFKHQEAVIRETAREVFTEKSVTVEYLVGTMIEVPRAALTADQIAESAEFFSFGTNDLTQTCLGISRDDAGFLANYRDNDITTHDPFQTLDEVGVGHLMRFAIEAGRKARTDIKLGICGEHGGDPTSVMFCQNIGLHYISCDPLRVPVARLAAAQAALIERSRAGNCDGNQ